MSNHTTTSVYRRTLAWTLGLFAMVVLWDLGAQDLPLAHWFGTSSGFALRDHWLWAKVLHEGGRRIAWALQFLLLLAVWWPVGVLRSLTRLQRAHMFVASMMCLLVVTVLKTIDSTSCPWDLAEFGGKVVYVSHWQWGQFDRGSGHCFPAGHASAAFCFLPGYFWLREKTPRAARVWLLATLIAGFTLGVAQQVRGAHYLSHTLWTGWLCWATAALTHGLLEYHKTRRVRVTGVARKP